VYGPTPGIFGEAGPEAVMPLDRIQPIVNKAVQSSLTTNVGGVVVQIAANKIDSNTNFDAVAVKIDKALKKLGKQRGER
jgi:ribosome-associated translation inhibitor RaiA